MLGVDIHDLTSGFKCWRSGALEAIDLDVVNSRGYAFQVEMTYRAIQAGFDVREIPIVFRDRQLGQSKMSSRVALEAMIQVWTMRFKRTS